MFNGRGIEKWMASLLISMAFLIVSATHVAAVATNVGQITGVPASVFAGGTFVMEEEGTGSSVTLNIGDNGELSGELPDGFNPNTVAKATIIPPQGQGEKKERRGRLGAYWRNGKLEIPYSAFGSAASTAAQGASVYERVLDTWVDIQGGYSTTSGINSTSTGAFPSGSSFLQGSGENEISAASYNFMLRHPFDRFRSILGGGAPFVFFQGSKFHGLDGTGGAGMSGTGLDQTALNRKISSAVGGGLGFQYPFFCLDGDRGGDKCFAIGGLVGGKAVRQQLSATADEAGNLRSFQDCFTDVVPFGGAMLTSPLFTGVNLVFTYEVMPVYTVNLNGRSFFNNNYSYQSEGGLLHNIWIGVSVNPAKMLSLM
jgi:hypothetical protein